MFSTSISILDVEILHLHINSKEKENSMTQNQAILVSRVLTPARQLNMLFENESP